MSARGLARSPFAFKKILLTCRCLSYLYAVKQINMRYDPVPTDLFRRNRQRFMRKMQPDSVAIFYSNAQVVRSGDTYYPFRQNNGLWYVSGLDQPASVVVLFPDCIKDGFQEVAFIRRPDAFTQQWEGASYTREQASAISGIDQVLWLDDLDRILHELILLARRVYLNIPEHLHQRDVQQDSNWQHGRALQERYPAHKYHRAQPVLRKLMALKSEEEIGLIQRAIDITGDTFNAILPTVRPGIMEYELEADMTAHFLRRRATGHAYPPIIASGGNSCVLHYQQNNHRCAEGEVLLMDFGAEYANYAADITRTVPVNGAFSERQQDIYQAVFGVLQEAKALFVPGKTLDDIQQEAGILMQEALLQLGLLTQKEVAQQSECYPAYKKYFMHSLAHHLGMDAHDMANRYDPIQAGMVFAVEPGIYIPGEKVGIRLENVVLVTDQGPQDLTGSIPIKIEDIVQKMQGMLIQD